MFDSPYHPGVSSITIDSHSTGRGVLPYMARIDFTVYNA